MKHLLAAVAATPLLIACASAGAAQIADAESQERVLVINGERIIIDDDTDAARAIEEALSDEHGGRRLVLEFQSSDDGPWRSEHREAFAMAMGELAGAFGGASGDFDFDFDFDLDDETVRWTDDDGAHVEVLVHRMEYEAEARAAHMERHAERMERQVERMAERAERHAGRAALHGLRSGLHGVESGLSSVERTLERGWHMEDGERVTLTDEQRADLEEARHDLIEARDELRVELAEAGARHPYSGEHREVRIVRRNGDARGWVDGEEVTGSELDRLLEGAPDAPEPPQAPEAPEAPGEQR